MDFCPEKMGNEGRKAGRQKMPQKAKRKNGTIVEQFRAKLGTRDYAKRRRIFSISSRNAVSFAGK